MLKYTIAVMRVTAIGVNEKGLVQFICAIIRQSERRLLEVFLVANRPSTSLEKPINPSQ